MDQANIRNFVIIAHIDHGKSTLADRFLELTGTILKRAHQEQYLDMMPLEREKGITIKMQPVRMLYRPWQFSINSFEHQKTKFWESSNQDSNLKTEYILNLIDTPGHVDFSYEVSRGLAAVEGAILLVDATKGVQAQTLSNLALAKKQGLCIIPAINKIDLKHANIDLTREQIKTVLDSRDQDILEISAKQGLNIKELLDQVITKVPPPSGDPNKPLRALIFDSKYDPYQGVIAFVRIVDGSVSESQEIYLIKQKVKGFAKEVGYFLPDLKPAPKLSAGEIGYIATGIKEPALIRVGDTITHFQSSISNFKMPPPLPGYQEPKPVVFVSVYPEKANDFPKLKRALEQLYLQDPAFSFEVERGQILGQGFRCSFLGTLHAEIIFERLRREFDLELIISKPQVPYQILKDKEVFFVYKANDFPDDSSKIVIKELWVELELITQAEYLGSILELLHTIEGRKKEIKNFGPGHFILVYSIPLRELMLGNFYEKIKSVSKGFASLNYNIIGWQPANLVRMDILIAGAKEDLLTEIVPKDKIYQEGRKIVEKLKEILPRQQFAVALQAKVGGKIVARETIPALKKDVTGYLYGGDYTRKRKLLEKQKRGKKELQKKMQGKLRISPETFLKILRA